MKARDMLWLLIHGAISIIVGAGFLHYYIENFNMIFLIASALFFAMAFLYLKDI